MNTETYLKAERIQDKIRHYKRIQERIKRNQIEDIFQFNMISLDDEIRNKIVVSIKETITTLCDEKITQLQQEFDEL